MNPTEIRLPNGPSGRWLPTLRFMRDARGTLEKWCQQYGDPILVNALNGPIVVTGRPDLISQIFSGDPMSLGIALLPLKIASGNWPIERSRSERTIWKAAKTFSHYF